MNLCLVLACLVCCPLVAAPDKGPQPDESKIRNLGEKRVAAAQKAFDGWRKFTLSGSRSDEDRLYHLSKHLLDAELCLDKKTESRIKAYQGHLNRMSDWEAVTKKWVKAGVSRAVDLLVIDSYRAEAEYWLEKAKHDENPK